MEMELEVSLESHSKMVKVPQNNLVQKAKSLIQQN